MYLCVYICMYVCMCLAMCVFLIVCTGVCTLRSVCILPFSVCVIGICSPHQNYTYIH